MKINVWDWCCSIVGKTTIYGTAIYIGISLCPGFYGSNPTCLIKQNKAQGLGACTDVGNPEEATGS